MGAAAAHGARCLGGARRYAMGYSARVAKRQAIGALSGVFNRRGFSDGKLASQQVIFSCGFAPGARRSTHREEPTIVIGHHLVWTAYGCWLPNDPRGSMSQWIERDVLKDLGELHHGRKRVQPASRVIREFYERAEALLRFPTLKFTDAEMSMIALSFAETIHVERYTCHACAIMPDHVHLLIRKHKDIAEEMIEKLQIASCRAVRESGVRDKFHPVWGGCGWKVFQDSVEDIKRTVRYVGDNPIKARLPAQSWDFVNPVRPAACSSYSGCADQED